MQSTTACTRCDASSRREAPRAKSHPKGRTAALEARSSERENSEWKMRAAADMEAHCNHQGSDDTPGSAMIGQLDRCQVHTLTATPSCSSDTSRTVAAGSHVGWQRCCSTKWVLACMLQLTPRTSAAQSAPAFTLKAVQHNEEGCPPPVSPPVFPCTLPPRNPAVRATHPPTGTRLSSAGADGDPNDPHAASLSAGSPGGAPIGVGTSPFLAVGVLSVGSYLHRRELVRATWGRLIAGGVGGPVAPTVLLRFVMLLKEAGDPEMHDRLAAEAAGHRDLLLLQNALDGALYVTKVLGWMRAALTLWPGVRWVMHADDDAFARVDLVLVDLKLLDAHGVSNVVYGAMEWQSFDQQQQLVVSDTFGARAEIAAACWRRYVNLTNSSRSAASYSRPFPFAKGPLKVWDAAMVRYLAYSEHAMAKLRDLEMAPPRQRVIEDVFIGYILGSAREGRGPRNVTFVDLVPAHGVRTDRLIPSLVEFRPSHLPLTRPPFGCARGVHFGKRPTSNAARNRLNSSDASALRSLAFKNLACHQAYGICPPPVMRCTAAQPHFMKATKNLITVGEDWTWCVVRLPQYTAAVNTNGSATRCDSK